MTHEWRPILAVISTSVLLHAVSKAEEAKSIKQKQFDRSKEEFEITQKNNAL